MNLHKFYVQFMVTKGRQVQKKDDIALKYDFS